MSSIDFRVGSLTGRLAGMVGASWKGIQYVRKMVIPANPNTVAQQGVRAVFAALVGFGRRINSTILLTGILPKPKKMSQFNKFIQNNKTMIDAGTFVYADLKISKGSLFSPGIDTEAGSITGDDVTITWLTIVEGEAQATDPVMIVIYNETLDLYSYSTNKTRTDATTTISITLDSGDVVHAYFFMLQGDTLASETDYALVTLA